MNEILSPSVVNLVTLLFLNSNMQVSSLDMLATFVLSLKNEEWKEKIQILATFHTEICLGQMKVRRTTYQFCVETRSDT